MASIQEEWNQAVDAVAMKAPTIPVIGNVHASVLKTAEDARADIKAQMQSRVRWTDSVKAMSNMGIKSFVEVGTGTVLGGLVKRIASDGVNYPLGNPQDFTAFE
jgi:[acyl-carrier-protein] S-malonyltransferase